MEYDALWTAQNARMLGVPAESAIMDAYKVEAVRVGLEWTRRVAAHHIKDGVRRSFKWDGAPSGNGLRLEVDYPNAAHHRRRRARAPRSDEDIEWQSSSDEDEAISTASSELGMDEVEEEVVEDEEDEEMAEGDDIEIDID